MVMLSLLGKGKIDSIHSASIEVLEKVGVMVKNQAALELLKAAGCVVEDNKVKMSQGLVEESLKTVPS